MKTFSEFQESVAALAIKGGSKAVPALMTGIGAVGTIMQARKKKESKESMLQRVRDAQRRIENEKKNEQEKLNTPTDIGQFTGKKVDEKTKKRMYKPENQFEDAAIANNVGSNKIDLLQMIKDRFKKKGLMGFVKKREKPEKKTLADLINLKTEETVAPTNNVGDGKIAGTVEAGDDPPVKKKKGKKKRYIYGGRGSRKMWMK